MRRTDKIVKTGFTLVEILTTIAVIAILLSFMVPALNKVQKSAQRAKQKAQFSAIEIALEAVYTDTGDYPPSTWNMDSDTSNPDYGYYASPQRLAEAVIGQDGFGLHKDTRWNGDWQDSAGNDLYGATAIADTNNKAARLGPYLELESANAVTLDTLYGTGNYGSLVPSFVLADSYKITRNSNTGKMIGSPILYYKANTNKVGHGVMPIVNNVYNYSDATGSSAVLGFGGIPGFTRSVNSLLDDTTPHDLTKDWFYERTANPNFTTTPRPYRSDSFILHSAGPDGLYGTADDIFNFDE